MAIVSPLPIYTPELTAPFSTSKVDLTKPTEPNKGMTMDTLELIANYNDLASGREFESPGSAEFFANRAITDLALDPVNLAEYPAVTDLDFAGAR